MKVKQAIILAAGESSRFWPLNTKHKSMIKIMGKTVIQKTIDGLRESGIMEIIIVQGPGRQIENELGKMPGIKYVVQKKSDGMGNAIMATENIVRGNFLVLNAERFDSCEYVKQMIKTSNGFALVASKTKEPWLFGILKISGKTATGIVEKPKRGKESSCLKVSGIYMLSEKFFEYHKKMKKSHYSFENALNKMMRHFPANIILARDELLPLKYPWHLLPFSRYIMAREMKNNISKAAKVSNSAVIEGYVHIGKGTRILENAVIRGPCWIGDHCLIGNNAIVRESNIENHCVIGANCEITRSVIQEDVHLHSGYVGDSVIEKGCRIGAGIITANVRSDKQAAKVFVKNEKIYTGMKSLGCMVGENCKMGIGVKTMPGVLIGKNCEIGPCSIIMKNVPDGTKFHTKFKRIIRRKQNTVSKP